MNYVAKSKTIKWPGRKGHSSSGADKHPYLKGGNEAAKTFAEIAHKRANKSGTILYDGLKPITEEQFQKLNQ